MTAQRWEVLTLCGGHYENVWSIDEQPEVFGSYDDAWTALNEHLSECESAVRLGHLDAMPSRDEFQIAPYVGGAL